MLGVPSCAPKLPVSGMRADPAVSKRLQQAAEQLRVAIQSARKRRKSRGDEDASPSGKAWQLAPTVMLAPERGEFEALDEMEEEAGDWQQHRSDEEAGSIGTSLASGSLPQSPTKGEEELRAVELVQDDPAIGGSMELDMHKAFEWMQRDVERQARENRSVRETLVRAIHDITDVVADYVAPDAASVLIHTAAAATGVSPERDNNAAMLQLEPDKVDELVGQWEDALVSWREQNIVEKQELMEGFTHFEEECLARMKAGEASHRSEQERLALEANQQQMTYEDRLSNFNQKLDGAQRSIESLQAQVTDLSSRLLAAHAPRVTFDAATETVENGPEDKDLERQVLDLTAHAKASELHALRCEAALAGQAQRAEETENRLQMLLEERLPQRKPVQNARVERTETVQLYRQKLELLEGRMQDVLQQVACDHEQFEYEQAKWALEKRLHREKYDEVLDASVKVLKVLVIREKLMKKHERVQTRRSEECQEKQLELVCQAATLQGMAHELMQQSAMVLLVLQQLAVLKASTGQSEGTSGSWTLPAQPVHMKMMIKRLKKIEAALGRRDGVSTDLAASTPRGRACPYPSEDKSV